MKFASAGVAMALITASPFASASGLATATATGTLNDFDRGAYCEYPLIPVALAATAFPNAGAWYRIEGDRVWHQGQASLDQGADGSFTAWVQVPNQIAVSMNCPRVEIRVTF